MKKSETSAPTEPKAGFIKRRFNIKKWIGFSFIRDNTMTIQDSIRKLFVPEYGIASESLENAMARLGISAQEIEKKKIALLRLAWLMVFLSILVFIYCGYNLMLGHYRAVIISAIVGLVSLAFAFRYHFWYFQLKEHKLGCSVKEWFRHGILGVKI